MTDAITAAIIEGLEKAISELEPPFLALPENGDTAETLAYRRGARDAYRNVLDTLKALP
jgi:hypothetical protein